MNQFIIKTVISTQTKEIRIACIWETVSSGTNQNRVFAGPGGLRLFFGLNKVAARKSTRKNYRKKFECKIDKKGDKFEFKTLFVKVQSLNLTFIYLQG